MQSTTEAVANAQRAAERERSQEQAAKQDRHATMQDTKGRRI